MDQKIAFTRKHQHQSDQIGNQICSLKIQMADALYFYNNFYAGPVDMQMDKHIQTNKHTHFMYPLIHLQACECVGYGVEKSADEVIVKVGGSVTCQLLKWCIPIEFEASNMMMLLMQIVPSVQWTSQMNMTGKSKATSQLQLLSQKPDDKSLSW